MFVTSPTTSFGIRLHKAKKLSDNTYPIVLQITVNRSVRRKRIGMYATIDQWDFQNHEYRKGIHGRREKNQQLEDIETKAQKLYKEQFANKPFNYKKFIELFKSKHALANARKNMRRIFDNKCSLINKEGTCYECTTLKGLLNPKQDAQIRANEIKMSKTKDNANKEYLLNLRLNLIKGINPLESTNSIFHTYLLENNPKWVEMAENEFFQKK